MSIGIRNVVRLAADVAITSSVTPVSTGLTAPMTGAQTIVGRAVFLLSVGATGGIRINPFMDVLGTGVFNWFLANTVAPSTAVARTVLGTPFTNALANAGLQWASCDFTVTGGSATVLPFIFQFAQNTSDALTGTLQAGSFMEYTYL